MSCLGCGSCVVELDDGHTVPSGRGLATLDSSLAADELMSAEPAFVGRAEEIRKLFSGIESALEARSAQLFVVTGAGGSGKTRLVHEVQRRLAVESRSIRFLTASVREGADGPFAPLSRLLLDRFGVTPSKGPTAVRGMMSTEVGRLLGGRDGALVAEVTHLLGHIAGVPFPDSPILRALESDPKRLVARTRAAIRVFLTADARQGGPLVIFLDKFNLAAPPAIGLLQDIVASSSQAPLCIVVAGRPPVAEMLEEITRGSDATTVRLGAFTQTQARDYLQAVLAKLPTVPEELVGAAWHRAEGNAASLRELARMFVEAGVIDCSTSPWSVHLERLRDGSLPVTMEDAHRARIARLDTDERRAMDRASVFGEVFWQEALVVLTRADRLADGAGTVGAWEDDLDARELHDLLRRLEAAGFVSMNEQGEFQHTIEYAFRHAGVRVLLYESIPAERRRAYHLRAAQWLENASGARREEYLSAIGEHFARGGEPRKAAFAYLYAADLARSSFHNEQAIRLYETGLGLVAPEDLNTRADAHHDLGSVYFLVGDYEKALHQFNRMLQAAWTLALRGKGGAALNRIGRVHRARGDLTLARSFLERALLLFRSADDTRGIASTLDDLGNLAGLEGDYEQALARSAEALELRRAMGDRRGTAVSLHTIGTIEAARGLFREAEACFGEALQIRREIDDHEGVAVTLNALGVLHSERGEHEAALGPWSEALQVAEAVGYRRMVATLLNNMGEAALLTNQLERAAELLGEAATIAEDLEDKRLIAELRRNLGRVHMKENDLSSALVELTRSRQLAEELGSKDSIALSLLSLGELHSLTLFDEGKSEPPTSSEQAPTEDPVDPAEELFRKALDIFEEIGNEKEMVKCLSSYGYYLLERGETARGKEKLERAAAIFHRFASKSGEKIRQMIQDL